MSLAGNLRVIPFYGDRVQTQTGVFPVHRTPMITPKSSARTVKCTLTTPTDLMVKIKEVFNGEDDTSPAAMMTSHSTDVSCNLCMIDTLERLGIDRYFQSEIRTILDDTYRLWQMMVNDSFHHFLEELAPYADQECINLRRIDVPTVIELYRAAQERITEEDSTLEKLYVWTSAFLKQQLLTEAIPVFLLGVNWLQNLHSHIDAIPRCKIIRQNASERRVH